MNFKKSISSTVEIIAIILLVSLFWQKSLVLVGVLSLLAYFKHKLFPLKNEFMWFVIAGFIGATGEILTMRSGVWYYAKPEFLTIPVWLPFLWGTSAAMLVTLYQGLVGL